MTEDAEARIRQRAYEIWQENGCPFGMEEAHWQQAQIELTAQDAYGLEPQAVQDMQAAHEIRKAKSRSSRTKRGAKPLV